MSTISFSIGQNTRPSVFTFFGMLCFSAIPFVVAMAGVGNPFLFMAFWRVGLGLGIGAFLAIRYWSLILDRGVWALIWRRCRSWMLVLVMVGYFDFALLVLSAGYVNIAVSTLLYELNPFLTGFALWWLFRRERRYRSFSVAAFFSFWIAVFGVFLVIWSQYGGHGLSHSFDAEDFRELLLGVGFGFASAYLAPLTVLAFRWAVDFARELPEDKGHDALSLEMFGVLVAVFVANLLVMPFMIGLGAIRGEQATLSIALWAIAAGLIPHSIGVLLRYWSMLETSNLSVNVIRYLSPVAALVWLSVGGFVVDLDYTLAIVGALLVLFANVVMVIEDRQAVDVAEKDMFPVLDIETLLAQGEGDALEFKTGLWRRSGGAGKGYFDREIRDHILRACAAFMNAQGGTVAVGIDDEGVVVGIGRVRDITNDKMSLYLTGIIRQRLGIKALMLSKVEFKGWDSRRVCLVRCLPANEPVYLIEDKREQFYIRKGAESNRLRLNEVVTYVRERFG